ncbi:cubilin, partial [Elysia marginata]
MLKVDLWNIQVLEVSFQNFSVEALPNGQCGGDFLEIHDGASALALTLGKFCGMSLPSGGKKISSTTNNMYLWFKSNAKIGASGFNLTWTSRDP